MCAAGHANPPSCPLSLSRGPWPPAFHPRSQRVDAPLASVTSLCISASRWAWLYRSHHLSISVLRFILDSPEGKWHVTKGLSHESPTFDSFFLPFLQWFRLWIQECSSCQCFLGRGHPAGTSWPRWLWKPGLRLPSSLHLDPKIATPEGSHFHSCQSEHRVG